VNGKNNPLGLFGFHGMAFLRPAERGVMSTALGRPAFFSNQLSSRFRRPRTNIEELSGGQRWTRLLAISRSALPIPKDFIA